MIVLTSEGPFMAPEDAAILILISSLVGVLAACLAGHCVDCWRGRRG